MRCDGAGTGRGGVGAVAYDFRDRATRRLPARAKRRSTDRRRRRRRVASTERPRLSPFHRHTLEQQQHRCLPSLRCLPRIITHRARLQDGVLNPSPSIPTENHGRGKAPFRTRLAAGLPLGPALLGPARQRSPVRRVPAAARGVRRLVHLGRPAAEPARLPAPAGPASRIQRAIRGVRAGRGARPGRAAASKVRACLGRTDDACGAAGRGLLLFPHEPKEEESC